MKTYPCPACRESTISFWQKHTLGPMRKITCGRCGAVIGIPFFLGYIFVLLAVIGSSLGGVAALLAILPSSPSLALGALVFGTILSGACILWFYERLVPLVVMKNH